MTVSKKAEMSGKEDMVANVAPNLQKTTTKKERWLKEETSNPKARRSGAAIAREEQIEAHYLVCCLYTTQHCFIVQTT